MTSVWLTQDNRLIQQAVDQLNSLLTLDKHVFTVFADSATALIGTALETSYERVEYKVDYSKDGYDPSGYIRIPIGAGYSVRTQRLDHKGKSHSTRIDFDDTYLKISWPYYHLADHSRVDWKKLVVYLNV